jgi:hypothetical protein
MTAIQYEELCRFFVAGAFRLPVERVLTMEILNATRPGLPDYFHQLDLYWETEVGVARYVHIANAKWRAPPDKVGLEDILLLEQVKTKVGAHKAVMITTIGFTDGALAAARDDGVALYLVRPKMDMARLHSTDRASIRRHLRELQQRPGVVYAHEVIHKGVDVSPPDRPRMTLTTPGCQLGSASAPCSTKQGVPRMRTK